MRTLFKHFVINTIALYLVSKAISGIVFEHGSTTLFFSGLALMIGSVLVKPIVNILLLPINLITFGLFRWVGTVIVLYLVTLVIPGFKILNFYFSGYDSYWFYIPQISLSGFLAIIAFSFVISLICSIIDWVFK